MLTTRRRTWYETLSAGVSWGLVAVCGGIVLLIIVGGLP